MIIAKNKDKNAALDLRQRKADNVIADKPAADISLEGQRRVIYLDLIIQQSDRKLLVIMHQVQAIQGSEIEH